MRKLKSVLLATLLICIFSCNSAMATEWKIEVNGEPIDAAVKIIDGRSLIPLRTVGEALGLDVEWVNETQCVILDGSTLLSHEKQSDVVVLDCKNNIYTATVDSLSNSRYRINTSDSEKLDIQSKMNVPPMNIEGRIYVPVRLVCDSFGAPVSVNNNEISIGSCFMASEKSSVKIVNLLYSDQDVVMASFRNALEDIASAVNNYTAAAESNDSKVMVENAKLAKNHIRSAESELATALSLCDKHSYMATAREHVNSIYSILYSYRDKTITESNCVSFWNNFVKDMFTIIDIEGQVEENFQTWVERMQQ